MHEDLNEAQRAAVLHQGGPLLVFAGAGSGKTRVITRRIAHALDARWYDPWSIVALTFTNKAAREMNERVVAQTGGIVSGLTIGTFHSTCAKWLRFYGPRFGHTGDFSIYDTDDQLSLIRRVLESMKIDSTAVTPRGVAQKIDRAKNKAESPKNVSGGIDPLSRLFPEIYRRYEQALQDSNALDFGDLVLHMVYLLEQNPEAARFFHDRFKMFLVDEYQDTNHVQYRLLRALAHGDCPELCVVGDDDQSIYKFRGADVGNILAFRRDYPQVTVVKLLENYRSKQSILDVSNSVIQNNTVREPKVLEATRGEGEKPTLHVYVDEREEAMAVARECAAHASGGGSLKEVAVLFRTNAQSRVLEESFSRARIPFLLVGGQRFYERAEVKDALSYLRLLVNPQSDIDILRIINTPTRGIGDKTVERLLAFAEDKRLRLWDLIVGKPEWLSQAGLSSGTVEKVQVFSQLMRGLKNDAETLPPPQVVINVLRESGLTRALEEDKSIEAESRLKNLEELLNAVTEWYAARSEGSLADYLEELALISDLDKMKGVEERVTLMTLHSAKGLEWKKVFLIGLENGVFPSIRRDGDTDYEEERRLFYVGVTRAMDKLMLSACQSRLLYGNRQIMEPSQFLLEIPRELLSRGTVERASYGSSTSSSSASRPLGARPSATPTMHAAVGKRARHATFGEGRVVSVSNDDGRLKYVVEFPAIGRKTVVAQYVQIG
jgi:DNA helicase II / ATP-dependent DNA helicase PcrA